MTTVAKAGFTNKDAHVEYIDLGVIVDTYMNENLYNDVNKRGKLVYGRMDSGLIV